eukprot:2066894-Prymnesium_polylepis.1
MAEAMLRATGLALPPQAAAATFTVTFPLSAYDRVLGACASASPSWCVDLVPIPRPILAAATVASAAAASAPAADAEALRGVPFDLVEQLAPYQREGVAFMLRRGGRALLADESRATPPLRARTAHAPRARTARTPCAHRARVPHAHTAHAPRALSLAPCALSRTWMPPAGSGAWQDGAGDR